MENKLNKNKKITVAKKEETPSQTPETPQELKVPEGVNLNELSELSGEKGLRRTKYSVPILKFNGNTGKFTLLTPNTQGSFEAKALRSLKISGVILKLRRSFTAFSKTQAGERISYFSNEHNSWRDRLVLFERRENAPKPKLIDEGSREEIKGRWAELKLRQYLYMLHDGEIVKFGVQGGNLGPFFEYLKSFKEGTHVFQFETEVSFHQEENDAGMTFYRLDFKRGKQSDLVVVSEKIKEVTKALNAQDKAFEEQGKLIQEDVKDVTPSFTNEDKADGIEAPTETLPLKKDGEEAPPLPPTPTDNEEEISVADIPM